MSEYKIKDFYWLYNTTVYKIKSEGKVWKYWNADNNRYIYKSVIDGKWCGYKKYIDSQKFKKFKNEKQAYKWFVKGTRAI